MNKKRCKILQYLKGLSIIILLAFIVVNIVYIAKRIFTNNPCPTIFGFGVAVVASNSMSPHMKKYDLVIISERDNYQVGDVITYNDEDVAVTHRIVEIVGTDDKTQFITQGDANDSKDDPINRSQVIGKVVKTIPSIGFILIFIQENILLISITLVLILLTLEMLKVNKSKYRK